MKYIIITILLCLVTLLASSQVQVKSDSVLSIKGSWATLRGKEMISGRTVVFPYHWKGLGKPELINQWFTIHENGTGKRKTKVTKNK